MQILVALAFAMAVNAQGCSVPNAGREACEVRSQNQATCLLAGCCWDGGGGRSLRCFRPAADDSPTATATDPPVIAATTNRVPLQTVSVVSSAGSAQTFPPVSRPSSTPSPAASANSSSGSNTGATIGYVFAAIVGAIILLAGGAYVYNKMTEDKDSSPSKLDFTQEQSKQPEPQLERHDDWIKDLPKNPVVVPVQSNQNYLNSPPSTAYDPNSYDPNAAYDPNAGYDPNAAYDPNAVYDPNSQYGQYQGEYNPEAGYYYDGGIQDQFYANQQNHRPNSNGNGNMYRGNQ